MAKMPEPGRAGQATDPPALFDLPDPPEPRQRSPLALTPDESRNVRIAVRRAAVKFGGFVALSARLGGVSRGALYRAANTKRRPSPGLAIRLADLLETTVEAILSGKLAAAPARRAA